MSKINYSKFWRNTLGVFASVVAAFLVVGVAWAGADSSSTSSTSSTAPGVSSEGSVSDNAPVLLETSTTLGESSSSSTSLADSSTSTTIQGTTSTSSDDNGGSTSTTIDDDRNGSTSTTIDDGPDDDSVESGLEDGTRTFEIGAAGSITVEVLLGRLLLLDVRANGGWSYEIEKNRSDKIEVRFSNGDARAEIEVEVKDGSLQTEIEVRHD